MQRGHHRLRAGRRVRAPQIPNSEMIVLKGDRALSEPERARRSHRGDAGLCLSTPAAPTRPRRSVSRTRRAATSRCGRTGASTKVNQTLLALDRSFAPDELIGKRFSDFLNMAGRIYYETHIAPLLRMQGFFNEFALDIVTAAGEPLPMICQRAGSAGMPTASRCSSGLP